MVLQTGTGKVGIDWGSFIAPGMNMLGGVMSSVGNIIGGAISSRKQYKYQSRLQQQQQQWLERMSNTAHQREVADLNAAGLNPLLSVMGGQGASTPTSGMGQINAPDYGSIGDAISTAMQIKQTRAQSNLMNQQAITERAKRENYEADSGLKRLSAINMQIQNSQLPQRFKKEMEEATSRIYANYVQSTAKQIESRANAKFQNERARGFSETKSHSYNVGSDAGNAVFKYGQNRSESKTHSKTY